MADLFESAAERRSQSRLNDVDLPLADRMRPCDLAEIVGQEHILGESRLLHRLIDADRVPSIIFWGPPGSGKTTLARIIAGRTSAHFESLSAVLSGIADLREALSRAKRQRAEHGRRTILFIDEIHRWSKAQQDALLDAVEHGIVTLIGATTENPSFEVNAALLSRVRVFVLEPLTEDDIRKLAKRALEDETHGLGHLRVDIEQDALDALAAGSHGDARRALSALEVAAADARRLHPTGPASVDRSLVEEALQHRALIYDKAGDAHYGVVSAFIKSMRGSDPDAATYYLVRMLESGEDPRFILRRMVIFASEDIGNADPNALVVATSALQAFEFVGLPEGVLPLTQAVTYLATAPKSNSALKAYATARKAVTERGPLPVPAKLLNATNPLDRSLGKGKNYRYPHDLGGIAPGETYLPDALIGQRYYDPVAQGHERIIRRRLERWRKPTKGG